MQASNQQSEGIKVHQPTNLASTTLWVFSKLNAEICWTWTSWEARASFESRYSIHWSRRKLRHKKWRQEKLKMFSSLVPFFQVPGLFTIATNKSKLFQNRSRSNFPIYKIGWKFTTPHHSAAPGHRIQFSQHSVIPLAVVVSEIGCSSQPQTLWFVEWIISDKLNFSTFR